MTHTQGFRTGTLLQQVKADLNAYVQRECSQIRRELDDCRVFWESEAENIRSAGAAQPQGTAPASLEGVQAPTSEPPIVRLTNEEVLQRAKELGPKFGGWAEKQILAAQAREDQSA